MADRLRGNGPTVLSETVADWLLPAPFADVLVDSAAMAEWVRSRGRRPVLERGRPRPHPDSGFMPIPSRGLAELVEHYKSASASPLTPSSFPPQGAGGAGGCAIDLGCGAGRDAFWLQKNGWKVLGVDRLPPQAEIPFVRANLHEFETEERFDLVLLHYCWGPEYFKLALSLCVPGGTVSILAHSEVSWLCFGHPRRSKTLALGNVGQICPIDFSVILEEEFWSLDRHSVRIVLERRS